MLLLESNPGPNFRRADSSSNRRHHDHFAFGLVRRQGHQVGNMRPSTSTLVLRGSVSFRRRWVPNSVPRPDEPLFVSVAVFLFPLLNRSSSDVPSRATFIDFVVCVWATYMSIIPSRWPADIRVPDEPATWGYLSSPSPLRGFHLLTDNIGGRISGRRGGHLSHFSPSRAPPAVT